MHIITFGEALILTTMDFIDSNSLCLLNNGENIYIQEPSKTFQAADLAICTAILFPIFIFSASGNIHNNDSFPLKKKKKKSFHNFNFTS